MGDSIKSILSNIKTKDALTKLIIVNVAVFFILALLNVFSVLFELFGPERLSDLILPYIGVSSGIKTVVTHIWTVFTYMFVHYEILHILFNMLMLYWFGRIFLMYFTPKHLVALYILGGIAGALFYILVFNTIPYFVKKGDIPMIGASASVMAVIFAAAFYNKKMEIGLLFFGRIKIIYIALVFFVLDFIALGKGYNQGGHIAHIGGAILGYFFTVRYLKGKDITKGLNKAIDKIVNLFKPRPKMKVTHKQTERERDYDYNKRKYNEAEEIDRILDKIKQSGYTSLSDDEKKRLFDASNR